MNNTSLMFFDYRFLYFNTHLYQFQAYVWSYLYLPLHRVMVLFAKNTSICSFSTHHMVLSALSESQGHSFSWKNRFHMLIFSTTHGPISSQYTVGSYFSFADLIFCAYFRHIAWSYLYSQHYRVISPPCQPQLSMLLHAQHIVLHAIISQVVYQIIIVPVH